MTPFSGLPPNAQGAIWMLASVAGATAMTLAVRVLTPELHTAMLAFLRSALALVLALPFLVGARMRGRPLRFSMWKRHLLRGALISVALNAGFYAIWQLPMATATILFFMAPVFATAFAALWLAEPVGLRRWSAIAAGFVGALVILRPGVGAFDPAMLAALVSSLAFAATLILGRTISDRDGSEAVFVSSSTVVVVFTLPPALWHWGLPADAAAWGVLAVLVLGSSARTYADIRAYAIGDAGFIAPFSYLRLVTVGIAGYLWFDERVDWAVLAGGAIIIGSTLYISLREARIRARRAAPRAAPAP